MAIEYINDINAAKKMKKFIKVQTFVTHTYIYKAVKNKKKSIHNNVIRIPEVALSFVCMCVFVFAKNWPKFITGSNFILTTTTTTKNHIRMIKLLNNRYKCLTVFLPYIF